jgi:hypothetical protein
MVGGCWYELVSPDDITLETLVVAGESDDVIWTHCHDDVSTKTDQHVTEDMVFASGRSGCDCDNDAPACPSGCNECDQCDECAGFRFALPMQRGARVLEAHLVLTVGKTGPDNATQNATTPLALTIFAHNALDLSFDTTPPDEAAPYLPGVPWPIGDPAEASEVTSPDIAGLVQAIVERPDYQPGASMTLVVDGVSLSTTGTFFGFVDFGGQGPARLTVRHLPPE